MSLNLTGRASVKLETVFNDHENQLKIRMKKIKIGLAGLGNVGRGVYEILQKDAALLSTRSRATFEITAVSARSKKEFVDAKIKFYSNALELAADADVDVVVEVIGGTEIAKNIVETALKNGKKIITANKALLAEHGAALAEIAEKSGIFFGFEAAVAGAIPVIKIFREGLAASEIKEFYAILNGTCNFILTKMQRENLDFLAALKQAQELGYAEADPAFDIDGTDTAHKLSLLAAIAGATKPAFGNFFVEGIEDVSIADIALAEALGYKIKLLAIYKKLDEATQIAVYPALIPSSEKIANIDDSYNAIASHGSNSGWNFAAGRGAGILPTASAIVADLLDMARGHNLPMFGVAASKLSAAKITDILQRSGRYFLVCASEAAETFGSEIKIEKQAEIVVNGKKFCGFITEILREEKLLQTLNGKALSPVKFLRVESCKSI